MDRKEFLGLAVKGAVAAGALYCFGCSTKSSNPVDTSGGVNITLDLNDSANAALKSDGGYVYNSGVIVINEAGVIRAFTQRCPHQGNTVEYLKSQGIIYCPAHGSTFNAANGSLTGGPATTGLTQFNVKVAGTKITITNQ